MHASASPFRRAQKPYTLARLTDSADPMATAFLLLWLHCAWAYPLAGLHLAGVDGAAVAPRGSSLSSSPLRPRHPPPPPPPPPP